MNINRWTLSLVAADYLRIRRHQLGREPHEHEIRGINGFAEYLINCLSHLEAIPTDQEARHADE